MIPEVNIMGKVPTTKIKVIPKGSIKARGISGSASPLQIMGIALLPTSLYLLLKYFSELVNFKSTMDLIASLRILFEFNSTSILFLFANLIYGIMKREIKR